jgi:cyclopropane-fatty-acyl-phospholipid synthase
MSLTLVQSQSSPSAQASLELFQLLFGNYHPRDWAVRFWDGTTWEPDPGQQARFTLVFKHPGAVRAMFWPPRSLSIAEAYLFDDYDVEGDIKNLWLLVKFLGEDRRLPLIDKLRFARHIFRLPRERRPRVGGPPKARLKGRKHSIARDREAVGYHYNLANEFFSLWLDRNMVYSCGYFHTPEDSIDKAQERKLDHVCRKLRLRPGEKLLDIGCGWGALPIHAARHYGVEALGATINQSQVDYANERIRKEGLTGRCRVENLDYRTIEGQFDKIASIGMFEHVGEAMLSGYFRKAYDLLKPGGVFLSHGIAVRGDQRMPTGPTFAHRYVFPDGELIPIGRNLTYAEKVGFEVGDVQSLRDHYHLTLRHWLRRLEEHADEVRSMTDDVTYRIYRLYLANSGLFFRLGRINVYQALLLKAPSGEMPLPLTRADWYA